MDRMLAKELGDEVKTALDAIATKHGLKVKFGGGTFDPVLGQYKPRIEFYQSDSAQVQFSQYAGAYGLEPSDFGRTFNLKGRQFTISGLKLRGSRPILATEDGKEYMFDSITIRQLLGKPPIVLSRSDNLLERK